MNQLPKLVTFDGEARSGKGTIVQATKDYLRDECGLNVMLIDRGQAFRALVVAATQRGVDVHDPAQIDAFLADEANLEYATQFVKDVYHMTKDERDALLYTNEVGENSAKIGARAASQIFVIGLTKKWMKDADNEGYDVVLIDGRALEAIACEMDHEKTCEYVLGLYFTCDATVGARRTLGYAATPYDELDETQKTEVDAFVVQINARNHADKTREVERLIPPAGAVTYALPDLPKTLASSPRPMLILDTSAELSKEAMAKPVARLVAQALG